MIKRVVFPSFSGPSVNFELFRVFVSDTEKRPELS